MLMLRFCDSLSIIVCQRFLAFWKVIFFFTCSAIYPYLALESSQWCFNTRIIALMKTKKTPTMKVEQA
jgi:hypothetical protein